MQSNGNQISVKKVMKRDYGRSGYGSPETSETGRRCRRGLKKDVNAFLVRNFFTPEDTEIEEPTHYIESDAEYEAYLERMERSSFYEMEDETLCNQEEATDEGSCYDDWDWEYEVNYDASPSDTLPVEEVFL